MSPDGPSSGRPGRGIVKVPTEALEDGRPALFQSAARVGERLTGRGVDAAGCPRHD